MQRIPCKSRAVPGDLQGTDDQTKIPPLEGMAGSTARPAQEHPIQVLAVADDITARGGAVRSDIGCVLRYRRRKVEDGIPISRMHRKFVTVHMARRTGWSGPADAVQVRPMANGIGATGGDGIVYFDKTPVQRIGEGPPLIRVDGKLVAEVTLGAGDLRNPPAKIGAVTGGTGFHMGFRLRHVPARQPVGGVSPADGVQVRLRIFVPASGERKEGKQQYYRQSYRRQRSSIYL